MDDFPEFFERAEHDSYAVRYAIRNKDYGALRSLIAKYAGDRWIDSMNQNRALRKISFSPDPLPFALQEFQFAKRGEH